MAEAMDVLGQELIVYRYTVAFPEYTFPIQERLRRFAKQCKPQRWRALARGLVDEAEKRAAYVERERGARELAPTDAVAFEGLRPPNEPAAAARLKAFLDAKAQRAGLAVAPAPSREEVARAAARAQQKGRRQEEDDSEEEEEESHAAAVQAKAAKAKAKAKGKGKQQPAAQYQSLEAAESVERLDDEVGELGEWSDSEGEEEGAGMELDGGDDDEDDEEEEEDSE